MPAQACGFRDATWNMQRDAARCSAPRKTTKEQSSHPPPQAPLSKSFDLTFLSNLRSVGRRDSMSGLLNLPLAFTASHQPAPRCSSPLLGEDGKVRRLRPGGAIRKRSTPNTQDDAVYAGRPVIWCHRRLSILSHGDLTFACQHPESAYHPDKDGAPKPRGRTCTHATPASWVRCIVPPLGRRTYPQLRSSPIDIMADIRSYSQSGRHRSVAEEPVTSVLQDGVVPVYERELTADEEVLAALGYKPEFKREFTLWTTFCVSFAVLGLLPSFASTLYYVRPRDESVRLEDMLTCLVHQREWVMLELPAWFGGGLLP